MACPVHSDDQSSTNPYELMPIALSPTQISPNQQATSIITGAGNNDGKPVETSASSGSTDKLQAVGKEIPQEEKVTLSAANGPASIAHIPIAPYAEIWKDGRKIAVIDNHGDVNSYDGLVPIPPGGSSGISLAIQRAALIAQSVGGEIRVAGLVTDVHTMAMRARLSKAYSVPLA